MAPLVPENCELELALTVCVQCNQTYVLQAAVLLHRCQLAWYNTIGKPLCMIELMCAAAGCIHVVKAAK